jgi:hypothetical protein
MVHLVSYFLQQSREATVFMYGFAKSERSDIKKDKEEALKQLAVHFLSLPGYSLGKT